MTIFTSPDALAEDGRPEAIVADELVEEAAEVENLPSCLVMRLHNGLTYRLTDYDHKRNTWVARSPD